MKKNYRLERIKVNLNISKFNIEDIPNPQGITSISILNKHRIDLIKQLNRMIKNKEKKDIIKYKELINEYTQRITNLNGNIKFDIEIEDESNEIENDKKYHIEKIKDNKINYKNKKSKTCKHNFILPTEEEIEKEVLEFKKLHE